MDCVDNLVYTRTYSVVNMRAKIQLGVFMKFKTSLVCAALALVSVNVFAQEEVLGDIPVFNNVQVAYAQLDVDDMDDFKPKGFTLGATKQFNNFYVAGSYVRGSDDQDMSYNYDDGYYFVDDNWKLDMAFTQMKLSLGYIVPTGNDGYIDMSVEYGEVKFEADIKGNWVEGIYDDAGQRDVVWGETYSGSEDASENLYGAQIRYTKYFGDIIVRASGGIERLDVDGADSELVFGLEGGYNFKENLSALISYSKGSDYNIVGGLVRYQF